MAGDKIVILTKENFDAEVLKSDKPVLIDFWASWCGPCRMVSPMIDSLAEEYEGRAKVCKVNVDEQDELAARFEVMSIPTVLIIKDGKPVEKSVGARTKAEFENMINRAL